MTIRMLVRTRTYLCLHAWKMASDGTTLVIKNPSRSNQHFSLSFRLDGTIADLQKLLSETYEGRPAPADQTLIYGGKVLKDTSVRLRDIVSKHDAPEGPHSIHLVIKQKPSVSQPSPARSVDSSASLSRAASTVGAGTSGASRPVPPPTRMVGGSPSAGAGPSSSGNQSSSRQAADPAAGVSSRVSQGDPDDVDAAASFFSSLAGFPGGTAGLYGAAFSGFPFAAPPVSGGIATDGSTTAQEGTAASASATASAAASAAAPLAAMQFMYYNPIVGGAYQAAYSAALAALSVASQQPVDVLQSAQQATATTSNMPAKDQAAAVGSTTDAETVLERVAPTDAAAVTATTALAAGAQQFAYVPMFVPAYGQAWYPFGMSGLYSFPQPAGAGSRQQAPAGWVWPPYPIGQFWTQPNSTAVGAGVGADGFGLMDLDDLLDALEGNARAAPGRRQGGRGQEAGVGHAYGGPAVREGQPGLRFRRARLVVPLGAAPGNQQPAAAAAAAARNRPAAAAWRPRVFTVRISARALLQALVFAIVLYQHFTWRRFLALLIGGAVLFITSTWAPLRRLIRGMHAMPARPAGAAGGAVDGAAAPAGAGAGAQGAAGHGAGQQVQRRGILHEILVFIVGFITSLLPAWNFNPEDAAAFAAAQELIAAAEERAGQQEAAGGEREAAPAEGAGAAPAQGGNEAPEGAAAPPAAPAPADP